MKKKWETPDMLVEKFGEEEIIITSGDPIQDGGYGGSTDPEDYPFL